MDGNMNLKYAFILLLTFVTVGCVAKTPSLDVSAARKTTIAQDPFLDSLRVGYLEFYDFETKNGNHEKAHTYGRKAIATTSNLIPEMEGVFDKQIPIDRLSGLLGAKYFVESAFVNGTQDLDPQSSSKAQLMFDCWTDQEEVRAKKGTDKKEVLPCQEEFNKARLRLSKALTEIRRIEKEKESVRLEAEKKQLEAAHQLELSKALAEQRRQLRKLPEYSIIFFAYNSKELDLSAKSVLDKVAKDIELFAPRKVVLRGSADLTGASDYNMKLSLARAEKATDYLVFEHGVDRKVLDVKAYGVNKPREDVASKSQKNRYVQIEFEFDNKFYPQQ
jgi:OOP family OmpA-OmpF porin